MKPVKTRISLDITKSGSQVSIPMFRGDTNRSLIFTLTENGKPYSLDDCDVAFTGIKADGNFLNNTCKVDYEKQVVIYNLYENNGDSDDHRQTTTTEGTVECQLVISKNDIRVASACFDIMVLKTIYNEEDILESDVALGAMKKYYVPVSRQIANISLNKDITAKQLNEALKTYPILVFNSEPDTSTQGNNGQIGIYKNTTDGSVSVYYCGGGNSGYTQWTKISADINELKESMSPAIGALIDAPTGTTGGRKKQLAVTPNESGDGYDLYICMGQNQDGTYKWVPVAKDLSDSIEYVPVDRTIADVDLKSNITKEKLRDALGTYPILTARYEATSDLKGEYGQLCLGGTADKQYKLYFCTGGTENNGYEWTLIGGVGVMPDNAVPATRTIAGVDLSGDITAEDLQTALDTYPIYTSSSLSDIEENLKVGQLALYSVYDGNTWTRDIYYRYSGGLYLIGGTTFNNNMLPDAIKKYLEENPVEVEGFVPVTRTIADIGLGENITVEQLQDALSAYPVLITHTDFNGGPGYVGQLAVGNFYKENPTVYLCTKKEETGEIDTPYKYTWVKIASAKPDLSDIPSWAKEKRASTYGQPRSLSLLDYFGANKKVVFVGDSFTQGFGSSECISYHITDDEGNDISIVGNSAEYGTLNNLPNYEVGKKLWSYGNRIWYEALDGNGYAHRLINYLKNKFGCTAKNYGMSGITTGHLLAQSMNAENSDLVTGGGTATVKVNLCDTQSDWVVGAINTTTGKPYDSPDALRTADYIKLDDYNDVVISSSDASIKFKVVYYNDNNEFVAFHGGGTGKWITEPLTLDKTVGSKALVTVYTGDITKHSAITITAETVTENEGGNIRVIDGLTNGFDTVFLTIGGNDRGFADYTTEDGEVVTAERQFESNLTRIVKYLVETANKKVILMSMTPCADDDKMRMSMAVIDGILEQVATEFDVPFISNYNGMLDYCAKTGIDINTLRTDNLHPNDEGYAVVGSIICDALGISEVDKNYVDNALANFKLSDEDKQDIANMVAQMMSAQNGGESDV